MEKIIEGIFAVEKEHQQKLVLVQTLRPHLLCVDLATADKIVLCCVGRLEDEEGRLVRALSTRVLDIMFQVSGVVVNVVRAVPPPPHPEQYLM